MLNVRVTVDATRFRSFMVRVTGDLEHRRDLNAVMARRLANELIDHFDAKNAVPNKMDAPSTNYWKQVAAATKVAEVTDTGATVTVADQRFNIQLFGGTVYPVKARFLTIPLVAEARGRFARDYERDTGRRLFTIPGRNALFEKTDAHARERLPGHTKGRVRGKNRGFTVNLAAGTGIRAVYALARSATIPKDPQALPPRSQLLAALQEEADAYVSRTIDSPA